MGGAWDSSAWFLAIYSGHYGLLMTPETLIVQPYPLEAVSVDGVRNLSYQGAVVQLALDAVRKVYSVKADRPIRVTLRPMGNATGIRVDGGMSHPEITIDLQPSHEYVVVSESGQ
jgi:hypothetical protein